MRNKSMVYIVSVLLVSFLYSGIYLFFPIKKLNENCILHTHTPYGDMCALSMGIVIVTFYMFIPLIVSIFLQKFIYKEPLKDIGFRFKFNFWYFIAWLFPVIFAWFTLYSAILIPGVEFDPTAKGFIEKYKNIMRQEQLDVLQKQMEHNSFNLFLFVAQMLIAGLTINAIFAFGEESGWRGFLLSSLKGKKFLHKTIIIGSVWGVWHFPVVIQGHNYPQNPLLGCFMMIAWCILLTPFFVYIVEKTNSVIPAAIMHGTINSSAGYSILYLKGGSDLLIGMTGLSGFAVLVFFNVLLVIYDKFIAKQKIIFY